ncbi:hypothetical protein Xbud_03556 [Xenorhabdus budapestensis]|uniref:Uncharacterized protein n=1 Tax=Xenorhabdus budapestensis TaxID=290110 RepID=A0A2D0INW9_XENBU|nr:hypothetical protein Xbud_03556 [Xenorhabdus budapestensis]
MTKPMTVPPAGCESHKAGMAMDLALWRYPVNDATDHGGKVITAIDSYVYQGIPIAAKGDLVCIPIGGI